LRRDNSSALQVAGGFFVSRLARARRAHKQSASVRDALRDADSWVAGGDKSGRAWTAHGVARAPVVLCREASERNAHRATKAAALIQQADAGRAPGKAPQAQTWPPRPPSQGSQGGGAFTDVPFMNREEGKDKDQVAWAWDRVLREAGARTKPRFVNISVRGFVDHVQSQSRKKKSGFSSHTGAGGRVIPVTVSVYEENAHSPRPSSPYASSSASSSSRSAKFYTLIESHALMVSTSSSSRSNGTVVKLAVDFGSYIELGRTVFVLVHVYGANALSDP